MKYTFKGYSLKKWLTINKNSLKTLIMAVAAFLTAVSVNSPPEYKALYTVIAGAGSKLIVDTLDYYLSE